MKLQSPLDDFPNDITYLNEEDCEVKIRLTNDPKLPLPFEQKWDKYRKLCCIGKYGDAARRCSMNDTLWGRYLKAMEAGRPLTLPVIKSMVEFDMARRELYPKDYTGNPDGNPPVEYIEKLKATGEYTEIIRKLDSISRKVQNSGQSPS